MNPPYIQTYINNSVILLIIQMLKIQENRNSWQKSHVLETSQNFTNNVFSGAHVLLKGASSPLLPHSMVIHKVFTDRKIAGNLTATNGCFITVGAEDQRVLLERESYRIIQCEAALSLLLAD